MDASHESRLWRARELLGSVGLVVWAGFHLWEQWSAFGGRESFVARMEATSLRPLSIAVELLLGILPIAAWIGVEIALRARRVPEPEALRDAMAEDPEAARRLGLLTRVASWLLYAWLAYHVAWLWLPKLAGADPIRTWVALRGELGGWLRASALAVGLSALLVHLWAAFPRLLVVIGLSRTAETRRAARLSGLILAIGFLFLYGQLAGWHAAGAGTLWPL